MRLALLLAACLNLEACSCPGGCGDWLSDEPCAEAADCAGGLKCEAGACVRTETTRSCTAGEKQCQDYNVIQCLADGSGFEQVEHCGVGCRDGTCIVAVCSASETRCEGDEILRCNHEATAFEPVLVCDQGCRDTREGAVCNDCGCAANSARCRVDGGIDRCVDCSWEAEACGDDELCVIADDGDRCERTICTPGEIRCEGSRVVQCASDGSGEVVVVACERGCADGACL